MENTDNLNIENELPVQNEQMNNQLPSFSSFFANFWTNKTAHQWIIFLFAFLLYSNTIGNKYAIDDLMVIQDNNYTRKGVNGLYGIFFYDTFNGFFGNQNNIVSGGRYRPLTVASFALENQLFGKVVKNNKNTSVLISYVQVESSKKDALINKLGNPKHSIKDAKKEIKDGREVEILTLNIEIAPGKIIPDRDGDLMYEGNPHLSHAVNALLFALLCLVLYLWIYKMFDSSEKGNKIAMFIAFIAAMLYAAHPLHTEAVANIKGRDEIAATLFAVLAAYWTMKSINSPKGLLYMTAAVIAFVLGLFSKESAIPFLVVIPAAIYFFQKEVKINTILFRTIPFIVATLFFWFGIRNAVLDSKLTSDEPMDLINNPFLKVNNNSENPQCVKFTEAEEKAMVLYTWFDYLKLLAIPYPLTSDYYPKHIGVSEHDTKPTEGTNITELRDENGKVRYIKDDLPTFGSPIVILSILLHLAMAVIAFWGIRKRNPISFALIFYAATFSVVSNLFFPIGTLLAERFMFMPSIALSLVCGFALSKITFSEDNSIKKLGLGISLTIFTLVLTLYSIISFSRNFDWYDNSTLFIKDIKVSVNSAKMNNDYANALLEINRKSKNISFEKRKQLCKEAIFYSANSINIYPLNKDAWVTHGLSYYSLADIIKNEADSLKRISNSFNEILKLYNHSITIFQKAREYDKSNENIKYNLKNVYQSKGNLLATLGRVKEAILDFEQANNYTDGYDVEIKRLLSAVNSVAAINSLKESDTLSSQEYHKQCLIAIDKGVKITPVHMLETIVNIKKAYLGLARENKEFEPISNQRVEELNKIIKSIDSNSKER